MLQDISLSSTLIFEVETKYVRKVRERRRREGGEEEEEEAEERRRGGGKRRRKRRRRRRRRGRRIVSIRFNFRLTPSYPPPFGLSCSLLAVVSVR